jgi:acyl dehydratase
VIDTLRERELSSPMIRLAHEYAASRSFHSKLTTLTTLPHARMTTEHEFAPGQVFTSPSKTLTDAHFLFFSGLTGDNHPIHYDVEYAKATRFGKPLAHGLLLASLTALGASEASQRLNGFVFREQGCHFLKPVTVGDTIHPRSVVESIWNEGKRRFIRFATTLTNQHGEAVVEGFHIYQILDHGKDAGKRDGQQT